MKNHTKEFSLFISVIVFVYSLYFFSFTSHAEIYRDEEGHPHVENWEDVKEFGVNWVLWASSQLGAVANFDFAKFVENEETWNNLWNEDNVSISEDGSGLILSEDLTSALKQALLEYAEETNGFTLISTTNINDLSAADFNSAYIYHSFRNIVHENGLVAVTGGGVSGNMCNQSLQFSLFLPFDKDSVKNSDSPGPVSLVKDSNYHSPYYDKVLYYDSYSWKWLNYTVYDCKVYYNTDEGHTAYKVIMSFDECEEKKSGTTTDFKNIGYSYIGWNPKDNFSKKYSGYFLYSTDGRKLKVFNSLNALKNYTAGQRSVYFGSGFYDEPGEIQVSFDDLEKYIDGKYDDFFNDLKDLIGKETDNEDSLTEEDLEKLVDQILDKMDEIGGGDNPGDGDDKPGTDNNTGFLQGMLDALSGYLDEITAYLDGILIQLGYISNQIEDMTADAVEEKADSVLLELFSAFGEIGDLLKTKFPFSIPWDIYSMLSFLSSDDPYDTLARAAPASYFDTGIMTYSSEDGLVINYDDAVMSSTEIDADSGIMPLMTNEDVNSGGNHGGGGSSRPGVGSHYDSEGKYHRAPFYEIPFQISKSMGIEGTLIIDLDPFIPLSEISRTMFTCIFIMSLISLSTKIIDALGDLFPSG